MNLNLNGVILKSLYINKLLVPKLKFSNKYNILRTRNLSQLLFFSTNKQTKILYKNAFQNTTYTLKFYRENKQNNMLTISIYNINYSQVNNTYKIL